MLSAGRQELKEFGQAVTGGMVAISDAFPWACSAAGTFVSGRRLMNRSKQRRRNLQLVGYSSRVGEQ